MKILRPICATLAALGVFALSACSSAPPAPTDRFYRLQATSDAQPVSGGINVRDVRADSLYAERPIVFTRSDDPRQLRQYHYHLWLYPPATTVREHLLASLGNGDGKASVKLDVRITAFERILDGGNGQALAALDVNATTPAGTVTTQRYRATQVAADDSFSAFAAAMEQALQKIYGELARDLGKLPASAR